MKILMGQKAKDVITGFQGIVTGKAQYITGCEQALLVPPVKPDGEFVSGNWFDEDRLDLVDPLIPALPKTANGPDTAPSRNF